LKKKSGVFVKINYKSNCGFDSKNSIYERKNAAEEGIELRKYLLCAGVLNKDGGMMIFQAESIEEAKEIATNNPFTKSSVYRYEILNSDIISLGC
jgi:uncharacterized protein